MKKKLLLLIGIILLILSPLAAFDGFSEFFDEPVEVAVGTESTTGTMNIDGSVGFSIEAIRGEDDPFKGQVNVGGGLNIDLSWRGSIVDARTSFALHPSNAEFAWYDVFTGLSLTAFYSNGFVEAGLLKKEWGSGDGVHVVDVLNAPDYRNGIVDDTMAMKMAEAMVGTTTTWGDTTLDIFYKPMLVPMMTAQEPSKWSLSPLIQPTTTINGADYEDLAVLTNSQFATRFKTIVGPADLGLIYYNGFNYQPVQTNVVFDTSPPPKITSMTLDFTRAQLFGAEATVVAGPFTLMFEGGFWLSEDFDGTDPTKYNNKWVYLGGIGYLFSDIGAYASITYNGQYIVGFSESSGDADFVQAQQSSNGKPYMNTVTAAVEMPLARERVTIRLGGTYQFETGGYALLPSVNWQVTDDFVFNASGRIFGAAGPAAPSIFKTWENNDSLKLSLSYLF